MGQGYYCGKAYRHSESDCKDAGNGYTMVKAVVKVTGLVSVVVW